MGLLGDVFGSVPGLGMVSDAIGTIGNIYSQSKANSTNKKLVRETNAQNYKMFQENLQNQWDMWNATNAYNDPSAQRERLQAAGLNPWLMMNGGNAGNAQGAITPTAPTAQAPHVDPVDTSGLGSPFRTYMELENATRQIRMTEKQIEGQQRYNEHQALGNFFDFATLWDRIKSIGLDRETKSFVKDFTKMQLQAYAADFETQRVMTQETLANIRENTKLLQQSQEVSRTQALLNESGVKTNAMQVHKMLQDIRESVSRVAVNLANRDLSYAEYQNVIHDAASKFLDNQKRVLDVEEKKIYLEYYRDMLEAELAGKRLEATSPYVPGGRISSRTDYVGPNRGSTSMPDVRLNWLPRWPWQQ